MNPELARIIDGENMPSPPTVAAKLLELVDNPDTGLNDISRVISVDPKLTAKTRSGAGIHPEPFGASMLVDF